MRGSYPTQRGSSTLDPPRSRPRAAFELPLGRRRSHTYATGENQQNASLKPGTRCTTRQDCAREAGRCTRARSSGGQRFWGAAAHLWPALRARARQRRRAGRPGASLRPSGDVGRQGADDNELRASSKAHMLLHAGGAAATCPHQSRLGRDRGTRPGFPSVLEPALLAMGGDDLRQATVDQTTARRHAVSDRLNLFDRRQRHLAQGGAAHLWWGGAASGFSSANVDNRGAEQPITGPGIAGISQ